MISLACIFSVHMKRLAIPETLFAPFTQCHANSPRGGATACRDYSSIPAVNCRRNDAREIQPDSKTARTVRLKHRVRNGLSLSFNSGRCQSGTIWACTGLRSSLRPRPSLGQRDAFQQWAPSCTDAQTNSVSTPYYTRTGQNIKTMSIKNVLQHLHICKWLFSKDSKEFSVLWLFQAFPRIICVLTYLLSSTFTILVLRTRRQMLINPSHCLLSSKR